NIVVLRNTGGGVLSNAGGVTLTLPAPLGFGAALPRAVLTGDFDGDGKTDLAVAAAEASFGTEVNSTVNVFRNTTTGGTLSFGSPVPTDTGNKGVFGLAAADFNADGKTDLAVAHAGTTAIGTAGDGGVAVLLNTGNGNF